MSKITQIIKEARDQGRLTALDFAQGIFDDFIELHGDRNFRDDGAVIGGIGRLGDQTVTVVGIQKGKKDASVPRLLIRKHEKVSKINVFKGREHGTKSKISY